LITYWIAYWIAYWITYWITYGITYGITYQLITERNLDLMIRSMTGFGRGAYKEGAKQFIAEIKTINHRYSDIYVRLPRQLSYLEDRVRETVSARFQRGKTEAFITFEDSSDGNVKVFIDESLAGAYITASQNLRDKYGLVDDISVSMVTRFPDVCRVEKAETDEEQIWNMMKNAVEEAIVNTISMRDKEGARLKEDILEKTLLIEGYLSEVSLLSPTVIADYKQRLHQRINELMEQKIPDEYRLATEVAIFAERCCIDEELVRFSSHILQLRETLEQSTPIGRKLDFLLQEMNREVNTVGSKSNNINITKYVVEIKTELEKIREQVQNIE
ncbi:MAG: YicC/YloC family endoribonuclease, partial [Clostridiales bacterium]|nr:YicC/YloC family endoribonuclease [Clostridiales bacterium]